MKFLGYLFAAVIAVGVFVYVAVAMFFRGLPF